MKLFPLPATGWGLGLFAYLYLTRLKMAIRGCFKSPLFGNKTFLIPLNPRHLLHLGRPQDRSGSPISWGTLIPVPPFFKGG
jgi:hypothetical protein